MNFPPENSSLYSLFDFEDFFQIPHVEEVLKAAKDFFTDPDSRLDSVSAVCVTSFGDVCIVEIPRQQLEKPQFLWNFGRFAKIYKKIVEHSYGL